MKIEEDYVGGAIVQAGDKLGYFHVGRQPIIHHARVPSIPCYNSEPSIVMWRAVESEMSTWNPTHLTLRSISHQTDLLIKQFSSHIAAFDKATEEDRTFGGPSLYFHYACIRKFAQVPIADKLGNLQFYEYLYATLASWGMHRMGDTATKLQNFAEFKSQIFAHLRARSLLFERDPVQRARCN
jgi:hypothetical protein